MKATARILRTLLIPVLACLLAAPGAYADPAAPAKLQSLRGADVEAPDSEADSFRNGRDRPPIPRDFVQQPPLIPHSVNSYNITKNFNKCMDCHSWSRYKETGATKVSLTHFKDRDGNEHANISTRRYFCLTCHVPQVDAKPLVNNTYRPANAVQ